MARYLNLSELAHVRWLASEATRRRRPRKAGRVRAFAANPRIHSGASPTRSPRSPLVRAVASAMTPHSEPRPRPYGPATPVPLPRRPLASPARLRRPLEAAPLEILQAVLAGLQRLGVSA
jgi:hypothetical protein